jgi:Ca2+-binding RTX toxin-like protein
MDFSINSTQLLFINSFPAGQEQAIRTQMKRAYDDSTIAQKMFDDWVITKGKKIFVTYAENKFESKTALGSDGITYNVPTGELFLDVSTLNNLGYIDPQGKAKPYTLVQALVHELGHALKGLQDTENLVTEYLGENARFANDIWKELNLAPMLSRPSTGYLDRQSLNYSYTRLAPIDDAVKVDNIGPQGLQGLDWSAPILSSTRDLLIGGSRNNVLKSGAGNDFLFGGDSNDTLDGGSGTDTAVYFGSIQNYKILPNIVESFNPFTLRTTSSWDGSFKVLGDELGLGVTTNFLLTDTDIVKNIEYLQFDDKKVSIQKYRPGYIGIDLINFSPVTQTPINDFNGDSNSDILWRNIDGSVAIWSLDGNAATSQFVDSVSLDWSIAGTGDFNGDLTEDILWRNDNGAVALWTMNDSIVTTSSVLGTVGIDWKIVGTGDFNGDSESDILWRNDNGTVALWQINDSILTTSNVLGTVGTDWKIAGTGDFNSDGESDILWRNDDGTVALWQINDLAYTAGASLGTITSDWKIAGSSDFNGDGSSDILWRNDNGTVALWQIDDLAYTTGAVIGTETTDWKIAETGDFNSDGKSDILWRNDNGSVVTWQMDGSYLVSASLTSIPSIDLAWKVATPILYT